ncbi:MAG: RHS repeat-associated core domain-containing protein [Sulfurovum sp.]|nr:RHS repeat-associated core domain-containing protein [Sulfurovum sp.]
MSNQEQKPSFKATTYPNGTKEHYTFNESKALASLHTAKRDYTYQRDALGRIVALTNEEGKEVENITYDGHYGKILKHTKEEETLNPYGYTGRETDQEDLYYYRARYYDPTTQRFLSLDPIEFEAGDFNFYRYVGGDPVNFVDPTGLLEELCIYSNVSKKSGFSSGHSWLRHTTEKNSTNYGLWPDSHPNIKDNGNKSDVRIGKEDKLSYEASYCRIITKEQSKKLQDILKKNHTWRYTNTCASFSSETFSEVTGVNIDANDNFGFETPRKVTESIETIKKNIRKGK